MKCKSKDELCAANEMNPIEDPLFRIFLCFVAKAYRTMQNSMSIYKYKHKNNTKLLPDEQSIRFPYSIQHNFQR